jgi:hypothetical protein
LTEMAASLIQIDTIAEVLIIAQEKKCTPTLRH